MTTEGEKERYARALRERDTDLVRVFRDHRQLFELLGQPVKESATHRSTA
jgi:hypothetical protein